MIRVETNDEDCDKTVDFGFLEMKVGEDFVSREIETVK